MSSRENVLMVIRGVYLILERRCQRREWLPEICA